MNEEYKYIFQKAMDLLDRASPENADITYDSNECKIWFLERWLLRERMFEILEENSNKEEGDLIYAQMCFANILPEGTLELDDLCIPLSLLLKNIKNNEELTLAVLKTRADVNNLEQ